MQNQNLARPSRCSQNVWADLIWYHSTQNIQACFKLDHVQMNYLASPSYNGNRLFVCLFCFVLFHLYLFSRESDGDATLDELSLARLGVADFQVSRLIL